MSHRVLVGVDGRPAARDAIALAQLLVGPGGRLSLAHVRGGELRPDGGDDRSEDPGGCADSEQLLGRERDASGVDAELVSVAAPSVGRGLHHLAETRGADLLVVGSCSRGFAGRVLLGNDTRGALNGAPCAVAIAPLGYAHARPAIATIGVGYDASPESEAALSAARELGAAHHAKLCALQVVPLPAAPFAGYASIAGIAAADEILADVEQRVTGLEGVDGRAVLGLTGEELAAFGDEVDLLVVGSRGYGPVQRMMFGSTSAHLAAHARCPLLVLARSADR